MCRDLEQMEASASRQRCMQRSELCRSLAGNSCPLITITNPSPEPHTLRPAVVFSGKAVLSSANSVKALQVWNSGACKIDVSRSCKSFAVCIESVHLKIGKPWGSDLHSHLDGNSDIAFFCVGLLTVRADYISVQQQRLEDAGREAQGSQKCRSNCSNAQRHGQ